MRSLAGYRRPIGFVLAAYTVALLLGTHLPKDAMVDLHEQDKVIHFLAYLGLSTLVFVYQSAVIGSRERVPFPLIAALVVFASIDEYTQQYSPGRYSTVSDWVANCAGICFGTLLWCGVLRNQFAAARIAAATDDRDHA